MKVLSQIVKNKKNEIKHQKTKMPGNSFDRLLKESSGLVIIAEIKRKSPSQGMLYSDSLAPLIRQYKSGGAAAISVVIDSTFFGGSIKEFKQIRALTKQPILLKDFVVDPLQVVTAYQLKANAILLIARIVNAKTLKQLVTLAQQLNLLPIVEVFHISEIKKVVHSGANCFAVNVRDLNSQTLNHKAAIKTLAAIPNTYTKLLFSGIENPTDIVAAQEAGVRAVLIGTSLLKSGSPAAKIRELRQPL